MAPDVDLDSTCLGTRIEPIKYGATVPSPFLCLYSISVSALFSVFVLLLSPPLDAALLLPDCCCVFNEVTSSIEVGELLCESLLEAPESTLLRFAINSNEVRKKNTVSCIQQ